MSIASHGFINKPVDILDFQYVPFKVSRQELSTAATEVKCKCFHGFLYKTLKYIADGVRFHTFKTAECGHQTIP